MGLQMDFIEVYESLLELFPQIDARALKAVAIEHNKDPNAAVEAVLEEIVPFFFERSAQSSPLNQSITMIESSEAAHGIEVNMSANVHSPSEPLVLIDSNATDTLQVDISGGLETEEKNSKYNLSENSLKISSSGMPQDARAILGELGKQSDATVRPSESDLEKSDVDMSIDTLEEKSTLSAMTESSQAQVMVVVEEIIEEARDSQKMLFTAMESIISLMRQVELKEQAVEQAKGESSVGGKDTMEKHAGEVYGEKAILGTELKELQSRVVSLSDKRDKSLAVLEEMQEFLVDRGHVVDMLQGEIAVICQDVRVLKEKFDEHIPLSKSLFSSQTSFILASAASSSSLSKSQSVDPVELLPTVKDDMLRTQDEQLPEVKTDREALVDDGWDFFEEREISA
ncbi:hypothetical protein STAS_02190 [Striga asiatica]|uniref:CUE domain-containing protein n=1 Tax=Striga asiatica TaxID=4170 RepID=A0A5A7P1X1_STRAF|nr:hypothetical protein STAS_02190 [Striga asiatica]